MIDAPRELVFEAWTQPGHLERWWGPDGFTTKTLEHRFAQGGVWRLVMIGPDGTEYPNLIVYEEIVQDERIVYRHKGGDDGATTEFRSTITFATEGDKTRVTMRGVFPTAEARDLVIERFGAAEGAQQTIRRLAELAEAQAKEPAPPFEVERTFDAPRALVFEVWTTAEHASKWFTPRPLETAECELDFREGGVFRLVMRTPDGQLFPFDGRFGAIARGESLVFFGRVHGGVDIHTTVTFADRGAGTLVRVRQTYSRASDATRGAHIGWKGSLDQLGEHVARLRAAAS